MSSLDPEKVKHLFPELQKRVIEVLMEYDPSGLYAMGAPSDEHDADADAIISALQTARDLDDVVRVLKDRLGGWIQGRGDVDDILGFCSRMAPDIWAAWGAFRDAAS